MGQSFTMRILPSRSMTCALISPGLEVYRISSGVLPSRICWRISGTQRGQSESVSRGQPNGGFVFSHDFSSGLSDHDGTNPGFCPIWLNLSKTNQAASAAYVRAFSAYLMGLCIVFELLLSEALPRMKIKNTLRTQIPDNPGQRSALEQSIRKREQSGPSIVIKMLNLLVVRYLEGLNGTLARVQWFVPVTKRTVYRK